MDLSLSVGVGVFDTATTRTRDVQRGACLRVVAKLLELELVQDVCVVSTRLVASNQGPRGVGSLV